MEGNYYLCIDSAIIIWDKRTTTMIRTNRLPIDRFMIIAMPDAECLGIDIQYVILHTPVLFLVASGTCRHLYGMAYQFLGMPLLACANFMFHGK